MREGFGDDELGKRRFDEFFPWHLGFFCRYRPLPEDVFGGRPLDDPLLQSRLGFAVDGEIEDDLPIVRAFVAMRERRRASRHFRSFVERRFGRRRHG